MCLRTEGLMHWLRRYTPAKLTWKWNIHHLKMYFLLNMGIFQLFLVSSHRCDGNEPVLFAGQSHVRIRCSSESQRPEGGFGKMRDIRGFGKMNDLWSIVICDCMTSWCDDSGGCRIVGKRFMIWLVVSNIFYFHPYLGKWSNLTNIFQMGWNHQLVMLPSQKVWKTFQMLSLTNWFVTGKTMKWWDWSRKFQTFSTGLASEIRRLHLLHFLVGRCINFAWNHATSERWCEIANALPISLKAVQITEIGESTVEISDSWSLGWCFLGCDSWGAITELGVPLFTSIADFHLTFYFPQCPPPVLARLSPRS